MSEPKKGFGCCFWGCLFFFAVGVVICGAVFYGAYQVYSAAYAVTSPTSVAIPEVTPDKTVADDAMARIEKFKAGGEADTELRLTPEEMNQIIANNPALKGKMHFSIKDKVLQIRASLALDDLLKGTYGESWFKGRYLTGKASVKFVKDRGFVSMELVSYESEEGKQVAPSEIAAFNSVHWGEKLANNKDFGPAIRELKDIRVEDDAVIFVRRAAAVQPDSSSSGSGSDSAKPASGSSDGNSESSSGGLKKGL